MRLRGLRPQLDMLEDIDVDADALDEYEAAENLYDRWTAQSGGEGMDLARGWSHAMDFDGGLRRRASRRDQRRVSSLFAAIVALLASPVCERVTL